MKRVRNKARNRVRNRWVMVEVRFMVEDRVGGVMVKVRFMVEDRVGLGLRTG